MWYHVFIGVYVCMCLCVCVCACVRVTSKPAPTAEMDRSGDQVYISVMAMVKAVVCLKNDVNTLPASQYPTAVKVERDV